MALYINGRYEWHVGEPIPARIERVTMFQADGDELDLFLDAMHASRGEANGICWEKGHSFRSLVVPEKKIYRIWYKLSGEFGTAVQIAPTGLTFPSQGRATLWIKTNPVHGGEWSIREENA